MAKRTNRSDANEKRTRTKRPFGGWVGQVKDKGQERPGWYFRLRDPITGKVVQRLGGETETEAEAALFEFATRKAEDAARGVRSVTLAEFWGEFSDVVRSRVSERHFGNVDGQVTRAAAYFGERPMFAISRADMESYFAALAAEPGKRETVTRPNRAGETVREVVARPMSPATLRRHAAGLGPVWDAAIEREVATSNPVRSLQLPRAQEFEPVFLTPEQLRKLYAHTPARIRALVVFLGETGARLGEGRTLQWHQVATDLSGVTFQRTKSGKNRHVPLTDTAIEILRELRSARVAPLTGEDPVFTPTSKSQTERLYRAGVADAGLDSRTRVHDLRHAYGAGLAAAGVPLNVVSRLLGHSSLVVTNRYARHVPGGADALAVAALERARGAPPKVKRRGSRAGK